MAQQQKVSARKVAVYIRMAPGLKKWVKEQAERESRTFSAMAELLLAAAANADRYPREPEG